MKIFNNEVSIIIPKANQKERSLYKLNKKILAILSTNFAQVITYEASIISKKASKLVEREVMKVRCFYSEYLTQQNEALQKVVRLLLTEGKEDKVLLSFNGKLVILNRSLINI